MERIPSDSSHEQVVPYNPGWAEKFETEAAGLREFFGEELLDIEHIGSTSVLGLASKPIIDIMVLIESHKGADKYISSLEQLGYKFDEIAHTKGAAPERHFFRKGNLTEFHLSVSYTDRGSFWKRQLAFRDYLRSHPDERDRYAELKQNLIKEDPSGKERYLAGKKDLINEMIDKSGFVRWKPSEESKKE